MIQEEKNEEKDDFNDSEDELVLVSLDDAIKSLQTWVTFFEQQEMDKFKNGKMYTFLKSILKQFMNLKYKLKSKFK